MAKINENLYKSMSIASEDDLEAKLLPLDNKIQA